MSKKQVTASYCVLEVTLRKQTVRVFHKSVLKTIAKLRNRPQIGYSYSDTRQVGHTVLREDSRKEYRQGRDFPHPPSPALWPTQLPLQWVPGLFHGDKAAGAWRSPPTPHLAPRLKKE